MGFCENIDTVLSFTREWYVPEYRLHDSRWAAQRYRNYPLLSRAIAITAGLVTGAVKPFLFPIWAVVSLLVLPIIALISQDNGNKCLGTWCITLLAFGALVSYLWLSAYLHPPALLTAFLLLGALGASIIYHVHLAAREPRPSSFIKN